jgi:hypothetical protein
MRTRGWLTIVPVVALLAAGCQADQRDESIRPAAQEPLVEAPPVAPPTTTRAIEQQQIVSGDLENVDLDGRTLTVTSADATHEFRFSDSMSVTGAQGPQGLAAREGARVNVLYSEDPQGTKTALSVNVLE